LTRPLELNEDGSAKPSVVALGPEAQVAFEALHTWRQARYAEAASEWEQGILAKTPTLWLRLALVLESARFACNDDLKRESDLTFISAESAEGAHRLLAYFLAMGFKVHHLMTGKANKTGMTERMERFFYHLPNEFSVFEAKIYAESLKVPWKTVERWLRSKTCFKKIAHAGYAKLDENGNPMKKEMTSAAFVAAAGEFRRL
jgi:hypothetical protein